jgi:[ribosomal protein S5]-alanine N-acetyltransferase
MGQASYELSFPRISSNVNASLPSPNQLVIHLGSRFGFHRSLWIGKRTWIIGDFEGNNDIAFYMFSMENSRRVRRIMSIKNHQQEIILNGWTHRQIVTPRLVVRAFQPEDASDLYEYLSVEEIYRFEPGEPIDMQQAIELARQMAGTSDFWAVEHRSEAKVIGQIYFKQIDPSHLRTWEVGYILSPRYQRQGYASEAVGILVRSGFAVASVHRVFAHCNPDNTASWKLLEKIGFRREGWLKKQIFFRRDEKGHPLWKDTLVYAILEEEGTR